jgi:hypothetical protein
VEQKSKKAMELHEKYLDLKNALSLLKTRIFGVPNIVYIFVQSYIYIYIYIYTYIYMYV